MSRSTRWLYFLPLVDSEREILLQLWTLMNNLRASKEEARVTGRRKEEEEEEEEEVKIGTSD